MFELRSKTKWYWPLESDFIVQPPSPLEFPGPLTPPPPWNFQFPLWWGSGYFLEPAHIVWKYIFYCMYSIKTKILSMLGTEYFLKSREILVVTSAYAIRPYGLYGGGKVIRCQLVGGWNMLYVLGGKSCEKWRSHFCQVQKLVYFTNFFLSFS